MASAGLTRAEVAVSGVRFGVVGIGGVFVVAARRGRGLARDVVELALERARPIGPLSMWGPLAAEAAWPPGPVTVYGLPF